VSAEWCGNSHTTVLRDGDGYTLRAANYFNDKGVIEESLPDEAVFYDQLLLHLRQTLPALKVGDTLTVARSLISNKPAYLADKVKVAERGEDRVTLAFPEHRETFVFDRDDLRALKSWSSSRGEHLKRKKKFFSDYWNRNKPGDERLLR